MGLSHEEPSRVDRIRHWSVSFDASARDVLKGGLTNQIRAGNRARGDPHRLELGAQCGAIEG